MDEPDNYVAEGEKDERANFGAHRVPSVGWRYEGLFWLKLVRVALLHKNNWYKSVN